MAITIRPLSYGRALMDIFKLMLSLSQEEDLEVIPKGSLTVLPGVSILPAGLNYRALDRNSKCPGQSKYSIILTFNLIG